MTYYVSKITTNADGVVENVQTPYTETNAAIKQYFTECANAVDNPDYSVIVLDLIESSGVVHEHRIFTNNVNSIPTNEELSDAIAELAQNQSDLEDAVVEIADMVGGD